MVFEPGQVIPGKYHFSIGTAGSTSLVLQTVNLPLAWQTSAPSELTITGGTHVLASPCFHFLESTWRRYLELLGMKFGLCLLRPGFFPRGGGTVQALLQPCTRLQPLQLTDAGAVSKAPVVSVVARLPEGIAIRQARQAITRLHQFGLEAESRIESWHHGPGTVLMIELDTSPVPTLFFGLGARGKPAERVADEAVDQVIQFLRSPTGLDAHTADQLILPLTLADGPSTFHVSQVSSHLLTNIAVVRHFVDRAIECQGQEGEPGVVRIS